MRKIALILITIIMVTSCGSVKDRTVITKKAKAEKTVINTKEIALNTSNEVPEIAQSIINNAKKYQGTRYKYGGTTKHGMDCSGLVYTAFQENNIEIPRASIAMSKNGDWVDLKNVKEGDLLFFATKRNSRVVNHVGIVTAINGEDVEFIHASTSQGVITSKLKEKYWYFAFVQARRVL